MMTILNVTQKKWIIEGHDGSYLVVLEGVTRLPSSLSVRNGKNIESIAEKVDDEDFIRS
jgi:hypothetical protein